MSASNPTKRNPPPKRVARPANIDPGQRYGILEASAALNQSHVTTYAQIKSGELQSFVVGRRRYINGAVIISAARG